MRFSGFIDWKRREQRLTPPSSAAGRGEVKLVVQENAHRPSPSAEARFEVPVVSAFLEGFVDVHLEVCIRRAGKKKTDKFGVSAANVDVGFVTEFDA